MIKHNLQAGFSLVELMLAMALGLFLLAGLIQICASVKTTYRLQTALARIQENGRFTVHFLNQNIRLAGYAGCQNKLSPVLESGAIRGYNSDQLPEFLQNNRVVSGSDVVVVQKCAEKSDGSTQLVKIAYFIADTLRTDESGQRIYGLYQKIIGNENHPSQEIILGVDNMKVVYGVSNDHGKNIAQYLSVNQIDLQQWNQVSSVQIALLLDSMENVLQKPQTYIFNGQKITPSDRMLHKEWNTYITLRERRRLPALSRTE